MKTFSCAFLFLLILPTIVIAQTRDLNNNDVDSLRIALFDSENKLHQIQLNASIAELYSNMREADSVNKYKQDAIDVLNQIENREDKEEGYLKIIEAVIKMKLDTFSSEALGYVEDPRRRARIYLELDEYMYSTSSYGKEDCLKLMDSAYVNLKRNPTDELLVEYYYKRSYCHLDGFELVEALRLLKSAETILSDDFKDAPEIYNTLATVYQQLKDFNKAREMAQKGLELAKKDKNYFYIGTSLLGIAQASLSLEEYDRVKESGQTFFENSKISQENNYGLMCALFAKAALAKEELKLAEEYFTKGLKHGSSFETVKSQCHEGLSSIWHLRGNQLNSKFHANKAVELYNPKFDPRFSARNKGLAEVFARGNNYKKAYELVVSQLNQNEEFENINNPYTVVGTLLNDNFEKEKAILENEVNTQTQIGRRNIIIALGAAAIAFLTFLFFYIRKRNKSRQRILEKLVKEQTHEILEQKERLEELDSFKSRLYTNITHEFRTPLTVILGMSEQLKEGLNTLPEPKAKEKLSFIQRNGNSLLNLINQMLDLSKVENNELKTNYVQTDVVKYLRYIAESFHSHAETQNVLINVEALQSEILMDYDPEKLRQILSNLLSNAIKYTTSEGEVVIKIDRKDNNLQFSVSDTGLGIASESLPHIFDRFYQADDSISKTGGTGIGLALTKELVTLLKGSIEVESELNKGTTFTVNLPITNTAELKTIDEDEQNSINDLQPVIKEHVVDANQDSNLPRLLIIEDNADVVEYLASCLEDKYQLDFAYNGKAGIERAFDYIPDIIISDVMMPEKDGFEVCETLKNDQRTSHIPIVLLTAKADVESKIAGLSRGADAYLKKPFHQQELLAVLENLILIRKNLQEKYAQSSVEYKEEVDNKTFQHDPETIFLNKLRALVDIRLSDSTLTVEPICKEIGMGRTNLYVKLKAITGMSFNIYLRSLRLSKAKNLLETTTLNISEVAYAVGYDNPKYFSRLFSESFGTSPSKFRE